MNAILSIFMCFYVSSTSPERLTQYLNQTYHVTIDLPMFQKNVFVGMFLAYFLLTIVFLGFSIKGKLRPGGGTGFGVKHNSRGLSSGGGKRGGGGGWQTLKSHEKPRYGGGGGGGGGCGGGGV